MRRFQSLRGHVREARLRRRYRSLLADARTGSREVVLVYQMGKVGSSTAARALERALPGAAVLHVHALSDAGYAHAIRRQREATGFLTEHLVASEALREVIADIPGRLRVVTLTREPIARAISFVFEDWRKQMAAARGPGGSYDTARVCATLDQLLEGDNGVADPSAWFDRELRSVFDVDVFAAPYDRDAGFSIIENDRASVLVVRMEDLDRSLPAALSRWLGIPRDTVSTDRANEGGSAWYADAMHAVKSSYKPSSRACERVRATRYVRHFYDEGMLERWCGGGE